jgi:hypothetical protein
VIEYMPMAAIRTNNRRGVNHVYMLIALYKQFVAKFPLEAIIWISGIIALAFVDPSQNSHATICPIGYFGYDFCPGCGLGRSIAWLFHGSLQNSVSVHPLGIVVLAVLVRRIIQLTNNHLNSIWQK